MATVRLRGAAEPNGLHGLVMVAVVIYTFAGFWVYWLKTGHTTVGEGGTVTTVGSLVWIGPLMAWYLLYALIGDRGPFRVLWVVKVMTSA